MGKSFCEVVVEAPFILAKGFLIGFWTCTEPRPRYFFHRRSGIRRETLKEALSELFEWENLVYICLDEDAVPAFQKSVEMASPVLGIKIHSVKKIRGARFDFSCRAFDESYARECRRIFENLPEGAELTGWEPREGGSGRSGREDLSRPEYTFAGRGTVRGDFGDVIDVYLKARRSKAHSSILAGQIALDLEPQS